MLSRSLPSHGGIVTFGSAEPWIGGSVTVGSGLPLSAGGSVASAEPDGVGSTQTSSLVMKMQLRSRSSAARS